MVVKAFEGDNIDLEEQIKIFNFITKFTLLFDHRMSICFIYNIYLICICIYYLIEEDLTNLFYCLLSLESCLFSLVVLRKSPILSGLLNLI